MDRGKNRSDLLAAGRKKLQQFRKKKDHKGGGKSSGNSGKPEVDPDAVFADPVETSAEEVRIESGSGVESDRKEGGVSGLEPRNGDASVVEDRDNSVKDEEMVGFVPSNDDNHACDVKDSVSGTSFDVGVSGMDNGSDEIVLAVEQHKIEGFGCERASHEENGIMNEIIPEVVNKADEQSESNSHEGNLEMDSLPDSVATVETRDINVAEGQVVEKIGGFGEQPFAGEVVAVGRESLGGVLEEQEKSFEEKVEEGNLNNPTLLQDVPSGDSKGGLTSVVEEETGVDGRVEQGPVVVDNGAAESGLTGDVPSGESKGGLTSVVEEETGVDGRVEQGPIVVDNGAAESGLTGDVSDGLAKIVGEKIERIQENLPVELFTYQDFCSERDGLDASLEDTSVALRKIENVTVGSESVGDPGERDLSIEDAGEQQKEESFIQVKLGDTPSSTEDNLAAGIESLKNHLYQAYLAEGLLRLQLCEQTQAKAEFDQHYPGEVAMLRDLVKETERNKDGVSRELVHCMSELQDMAIKKAELECQCLSTTEEVESVKYHLYLTYISSSLIQLHLSEQTQVNEECCQHYYQELSRLQGIVKETQDSKALVIEELVCCQSERQDLAIRNEELENQCLSLREDVKELGDRVFKLQSMLDLSQEELVHVSSELAHFRGSLEALQKENFNLTATQNLEADARNKLAEEKELLSRENLELASELSQQKERLSILLDKQMLLEGNLREMGASFEQLIEENLYLSSSSDVYMVMIKEVVAKCSQLHLLYEGTGCQVSRSTMKGVDSNGAIDSSVASAVPDSVMVYHEKGPLPQKLVENDSSVSVVLRVLSSQLGEAEIALQNLEKSMNGMHFHNVSATKSGGRAVSRLIQAFESKVHDDDDVSNEVSSALEENPVSSYEIAMKQVNNIRDLLKQMKLALVKAVQCSVEKHNMRECHKEFEAVCESERLQRNNLEAKVDAVVEKQMTYKSRIDNLQNHLNELEQTATCEARSLLSFIKVLQKEANDRASVLEQEWNSIEAVLVDATKRLSTFTGASVPNNLDFGSYVSASMDAATKVIECMHEKLEAAHQHHMKLCSSKEEQNKLFLEMQERNKLAVNVMHNFYNNVRELVSSLCQDTEGADLDAEDEDILQLLTENWETLMTKLHNSVDDLLCVRSAYSALESELAASNEKIVEQDKRCTDLASKLEDVVHAKYELESVLINKSNEIEKFNRRCLALAKRLDCYRLSEGPATITKLDVQVTSTKQENDLPNSGLSCLETSVDGLIEKYEEILEQINLSKSCLLEFNMVPDIPADCWNLSLPSLLKEEIVPKVIELGGLQEKVCLLGASNLQLENELLNLKDELSKLQQSIEVAHSELQLKVSELEQSEQRLSSVREKLSMAVAKGKGLIVQRDSLKLSLMEKCSELEKCQQELLLNETLLQEAETKLKSYSEVERVEALESELSYIRNSATAMRDSFLLKDSILQRIEEVLEDLDLPEHFHSKDIVEKVEMLARLVVGGISFPVNDCDHKSSAEGSQAGAGFVVMDGYNDVPQQCSKLGIDELKRKYDELQSRFYGLAEHNDMLEQSLMERNSVVQKWEEVLDSIDMPPQVMILEPEDKIGWLGRSLSEVQQERDLLQLKFQNLEASSDMLSTDLEESRKRISELSAEVATLKSEKEFISERLDKMRSEYLSLSDKAVEDEVDREQLQKELASLKEMLIKKVVEKDHQIENEMQKLHELICSALSESDSSDALPGTNGIERLKALVRKLTDKCITLSENKPLHEGAVKELVMNDSNLLLDKDASEDVQQRTDQDLMAVKLELDEAQRDLDIVKKERDAIIDKCHILISELETVNKQQELLQAEKIAAVERYQSLVSDLETVVKQRDSLQEQLTEEEQKSASARERLNVAVRKGKGLVQQRDSLKQTIDEMNVMVEHLRAEHNQQVEALQSEKSQVLNQLAVSEQNLRDKSQALSGLMTSLNAIDVDTELNMVDPVQKMEVIGKLIHDLKSSLVSSEQEAKKSKRAADLLLAELNEVQERADVLQEELVKVEASHFECSEQTYAAEAARDDALSHLKQLKVIHSEEREKLTDHLRKLTSGIEQSREGYIGLSDLLASLFSKNVDLFCYVENFMEYILKYLPGETMAGLPVLESNSLLSRYPINEEESHMIASTPDPWIKGQVDDSLVAENLALADWSLHECIREYDKLKENIYQHSVFIGQKASSLPKIVGIVQRELTSLRELSESLGKDTNGLKEMLKEKEKEVHSLSRNLSILCEACSSSIAEIENRNAQKSENSLLPGELVAEKLQVGWHSPGSINYDEPVGVHAFPFTEDFIISLAGNLLSNVKNSMGIKEMDENQERELKSSILDLQRELQEKDIQMNRICEELVSQIKEAESVAKKLSVNLNSAKVQVSSLEKQVEALENDKISLELRVNELIALEASSEAHEGKIKSLTDALSAKDQEIETLIRALDEEESQMEVLENKNRELEDIVQDKDIALESLEASRLKALGKLSTSVSKFDELRDLSENLLTEVENLQSQLQEKDSEISFLRQEVTRCTNEILAVENNNKKYSSDVHELLKWMEAMASRFGVHQLHLDDEKSSQIHVCTEILEKHILNMMVELDDIRLTAQSKDALLQIERVRVEELLQKVETIETSLREKDTQIQLFRGRASSESGINSMGHLEIEQMRNKVVSAVTPHVRGARKVNGDQIAIAVDNEQDDIVVSDEDDDKAHGFKALTMSRIVPRATRPIADRIDAIWVSGDRLLMRQPALRLGVILYWIMLHALLASII